MFLRISEFQNLQTFVIHVNLRLLYVFGVPAILGTLLCGGVQRALRGKPTIFWTAFALWMFVSVPTSAWPGGTFSNAMGNFRTNLPMVFTIGGLIIGWREFQLVMRFFAWGAFGALFLARFFASPDAQSRLSLEFGSVGNSNDLACLLLLVLPFVYWLVLSSRSWLLKCIASAAIAYGIYVIIGTASRGALIGLSAVVALFLIWGSMRQRIALIVFAPIALAIVLTGVSHETLNRILSFSASDKNASVEALESSETRRYLLTKSIEYTLKFPVFGVGAGMFGIYEGSHSLVLGTHGSYHGTHNTFTQVSSELGIPGLIFFVGGLGGSIAIFYSIFREARKRPNCTDMRNAMFCILLGLTGFIVSFTFLNFAYYFYEPLLGGMAVAASAAAKEEFAKRDYEAAQVAPPPVLFPPSRIRFS